MNRNQAYDCESRFIRSYIAPSCREQVSSQLAGGDTRHQCIRALAAYPKQALLTDRLHLLRSGCMYTEVLSLARAGHCSEAAPVYIMHSRRDYDCIVLPLKDALILLWYAGPCMMMTEDLSFVFCILESGSYACSRALLDRDAPQAAR